jgi:hypothetical protein
MDFGLDPSRLMRCFTLAGGVLMDEAVARSQFAPRG